MENEIHEMPKLGEMTFEMSPSIGKLFGALAKARKTFKPVFKKSENPFFKSKYADLAEVLEATVDSLSDNGIAIIQAPLGAERGVEIVTFMGHESGEWMKATLPMPVSKPDAQGFGSAITYGRRYAYSAMVNVASEFDEDGNAASGKEAPSLPKPPIKKLAEAKDLNKAIEKPAPDSFKLKFWRTAKATGKNELEIRNYIGFLGYEHTEDIPAKLQKEALDWAAEQTQ